MGQVQCRLMVTRKATGDCQIVLGAYKGLLDKGPVKPKNKEAISGN
jgi:hypothetical protein